MRYSHNRTGIIFHLDNNINLALTDTPLQFIEKTNLASQ